MSKKSTCVSCGGSLAPNARGDVTHKCSPRHVTGREGANTQANTGREAPLSYVRRLTQGFAYFNQMGARDNA